MSKLTEYILDKCIRGDCTCGKCVGIHTEKFQPNGQTADVQFFKVALKNGPTDEEKEIIKNKLIELIKEHEGEFCEVDLFDGNEHNYPEIGGWIGDQSLALTLMGMGEILNIWKLTTPNSVSSELTEETRRMLADAGYISIRFNGMI